ncbi:MAG: DUF620 domain-containing protein, partial [Planctomycetota bacterium]
MTRSATRFLLAASFLLAISSGSLAQMGTDELLKKMIEAQGGTERLSDIRTAVLKGTMILVAQGGVSGGITITNAFPDRTLIEMELAGTKIAQGYDGKIAWMDNPLAGGYAELPEAQAESMRREASGFGALVAPEEFGISYNYRGIETDAGVEYHVLEQIFGAEDVTAVYVDVNTFLIHKTKTVTGSLTQPIVSETHLADYRETDGIKQAHQVSSFSNDQEIARYLFDHVVYNVEVDDAIFKGARKRFTKKELITDARQLAAIIEDTHPDPYKHIGGKIAFHRRLQ